MSCGRPCPSQRSWRTRRRARATSSSFRPSSTSAEPAMPDLTRLHAHEMAALLRGRRGFVARADRGAPGRRRARQPGAQRLADDRSRARAGRGRCGRRTARCCPDRWLGRPRSPSAAARHSGGTQGPGVPRRRPVHGWFTNPRGLSGPVRLARDGAAARGGRGDPRQDEHGRVRHGLLDRAFGVWADGQPLGARPGPGWQQRRIGRRRRRLPRAPRDRDGHRRIHPPAGRAVRDRRDEADLRPGQPLRDRGLRQLARPDRAVRPGRPRCRRAAPCHRRP